MMAYLLTWKPDLEVPRPLDAPPLFYAASLVERAENAATSGCRLIAVMG
jgi:hypothetical protein